VVDHVEDRDETGEVAALRFRRSLKDVESAYDLVIASAIFEHLPNLSQDMRQVYAKVRAGGFMYARTPYLAPWIKHLKVAMGYPAHVHDLGDEFWNRFSETFELPMDIVVSRPSIVETGFDQAFLRTLAAYVCKFPARLEARFSRRVSWKLYGGWEVIFRKPL
jgi:hypothetical protein